MSLKLIAEKSFISTFHFHRLFKLYTQEPLNAFINRLRIEKAAGLLIRNKDLTIFEISLQVGFASNASFSKSFKKYYKIYPSEFRKTNPHYFSKIGQTESKIGQQEEKIQDYLREMNKHKNWTMTNANIRIENINKMKMASILHIGDIGFEQKFNDLLSWSGKNGLLENNDLKVGTMYYDSYKITKSEKIRKSAFVIINKELEPEGAITFNEIPEGTYIIAHHEIQVGEFATAWSGLFIWMNENGHKMKKENPFEIYHNNFNEHPEKICFVDFYIPIEK